MQTDLVIRAERQGEESAIRDVSSAAFDQGDEADVVDQLRKDDEIVISLVALKMTGLSAMFC